MRVEREDGQKIGWEGGRERKRSHLLRNSEKRSLLEWCDGDEG